jgi:hypothetical protein
MQLQISYKSCLAKNKKASHFCKALICLARRIRPIWELDYNGFALILALARMGCQ